MATLVFFHAHPDDESIMTAGSMAQAADAGHRVVLVLATGGELGEVAEGVLDDGESVAERRRVETDAAAAVLGVARIAHLGYHDSGMEGEDTNGHDHAFAAADVEEAAQRLADLLRAEDAEVLTIYDDHGNYGHPDHVQVHRVGARAAELAGTPRVFEATVNRDHFIELMRARADELAAVPDAPAVEEMEMGVTADQITTAVDVSAVIDRKRAAMAAHASQIPADSFFLTLPDDAFTAAFGTEWFIRRGAEPGQPWETSLLG